MWLDELQTLLLARSANIGTCRVWQRAKSAAGYGQFRFGNVTYYAHRASYLLANGCLAKTQVVRHSCNTPACINPGHLMAGTQADNLADAAKLGRAGRKPRLSNAAVLRIQDSDAKQAVLAQNYGVTQSMISKIQAKKTRRVPHVYG